MLRKLNETFDGIDSTTKLYDLDRKNLDARIDPSGSL